MKIKTNKSVSTTNHKNYPAKKNKTLNNSKILHIQIKNRQKNGNRPCVASYTTPFEMYKAIFGIDMKEIIGEVIDKQKNWQKKNGSRPFTASSSAKSSFKKFKTMFGIDIGEMIEEIMDDLLKFAKEETK